MSQTIGIMLEHGIVSPGITVDQSPEVPKWFVKSGLENIKESWGKLVKSVSNFIRHVLPDDHVNVPGNVVHVCFEWIVSSKDSFQVGQGRISFNEGLVVAKLDLDDMVCGCVKTSKSFHVVPDLSLSHA